MKKRYINVDMEIIEFDTEDIVTTSETSETKEAGYYDPGDRNLSNNEP